MYLNLYWIKTAESQCLTPFSHPHLPCLIVRPKCPTQLITRPATDMITIHFHLHYFLNNISILIILMFSHFHGSPSGRVLNIYQPKICTHFLSPKSNPKPNPSLSAAQIMSFHTFLLYLLLSTLSPVVWHSVTLTGYYHRKNVLFVRRYENVWNHRYFYYLFIYGLFNYAVSNSEYTASTLLHYNLRANSINKSNQFRKK